MRQVIALSNIKHAWLRFPIFDHLPSLRSPLFVRSNTDNLVLEDQQQRLAAWTGLHSKELALVLKDCKSASDAEKAAACDLLKRCLQSEPEQRPTMKSVLEFPFLSGRAADMQRILDNHDVLNTKMDALAVQLQHAKVTIAIVTLPSHARLRAQNFARLRVNLLQISPGVAYARYDVGG
jgi:serine/threonine protein kinase